ncbi:class I SAM-dependent methyltransferase [Candidatus Woesearchaeota archaeon]|jgi:ubiquinone/menaquinone biosynthesis C-methylase UbiE|nr:class I SAM-dependent methyltransferase [Candidatus Woesearchaeota archaeon]MBT4321626.1 class I SAM-dependent methyltransferase [Candidatus Woesearchaeota archaeon]MBT4631063.1 class I SAM-dependent methyltransferase [Candidatus Woesearchaeota archaeon]
MNVEKHTKKMYDQFGKEYQKTRKEKHKSRLYNEFLEVPCMIKAVGNIKGKKLLDIGCGAGVHIKKYLSKGAKCRGMDISKSMIDMAKQNCPNVDFKIGPMTKLPYKNSSFDIVTASLSVDYIKNLIPVFKEISRVLKKGGVFYYSNESPIASARERYEDKNFKIFGIGKFIDKKTGKQIALGRGWNERLAKWEMVPGMLMKTYNKTFRTQLKSLREAGFELIDLIDCKPTTTFRKYEPAAFKIFSKFPLFSIYVSQKK